MRWWCGGDGGGGGGGVACFVLVRGAICFCLAGACKGEGGADDHMLMHNSGAR